MLTQNILASRRPSGFQLFSVLESQKQPLIDRVLRARGPTYQRLEVNSSSPKFIYAYQIRGSAEPLYGEYCFVRVQQESGLQWRISPNKEGVASHMELLDNLAMSVVFAGTLFFWNNKLIYWTNRSGSFQIPATYANQAGLPMELFRGL